MGNSVFRRLYGEREVRLLVVGLDNAGKTTLMCRLKMGEVVTTRTSRMFTMETVDYKNINVTSWDVGGRCSRRVQYRRMVKAIPHGLVYVLDGCDRRRLAESLYELKYILNMPEMSAIPLVVLINKGDRPNAMLCNEVKDRMSKMQTSALLQNRHWEVYPVCVSTSKGLDTALNWLTGTIARRMARDYLVQPTKTTEGKNDIWVDGYSYLYSSITDMGASAWSYISGAVNHLNKRCL